ncbi:DUF6319 family protein [Nocardia blacklockiae]|uniref:DUF6319 family protein n=1 Tax=Nocardia blacklockiae TaxID=480036 RepID=UPI0018958DD0|nr:DUF6319 family protein [Nocardia blacklockiae]MBF6174798.1 hypothetical protein [Nocardia blacklockiae]
MSSRRTKPQPLSDTEIRQIAAEITGGRPPMVWFTADAVGVPEGRSGKVVALGDPTEGDFLQVRPTGSKDVLSFSPTEVTLAKPVRAKPAAPDQTAKKTTATRKDTAVSMPSTVTQSPAPAGSAPVQTAVAEAAPKPAAPASAPKPAAKPSQGAAARPAQKSTTSTARKSKTPEVTVTLSGTADGEWTVDVVHGKKRTRGLSVPGATVAQAAKLLHPEVAEVVDAVLESVRSSQRAKVEQLQAELEQARRVLDDLSG